MFCCHIGFWCKFQQCLQSSGITNEPLHILFFILQQLKKIVNTCILKIQITINMNFIEKRIYIIQCAVYYWKLQVHDSRKNFCNFLRKNFILWLTRYHIYGQFIISIQLFDTTKVNRLLKYSLCLHIWNCDEVMLQ